jgi:hypothetical protein
MVELLTSKLNSVKKKFNLALNSEKNGVLNIDIRSIFKGKNFGQFVQNWVKSGQTLEIFSQPRDL